MTWRNPPPLKQTKSKAKPITPEDLAKTNSEDGHQAAFFAWAASVLNEYPQLKYMHAIPNGGSRHMVEAIKMVSTGTRSGVWDVFLPVPVQMYHGLYIEMKKPGREKEKNEGLSDAQVEFGKHIDSMGYAYKVCYSWIEAKDVVLNYLNIMRV